MTASPDNSAPASTTRLARRWKLVRLAVIACGLAAIGLACLFNPPVLARCVSSDGQLERTTMMRLYVLDAVAILTGVLLLFAARVLRVHTKSKEKVVKGLLVSSASVLVMLLATECALQIANRDGRLIARAVLKDYKKPGTSQDVTLPHRIDLDWPEAKLSLTIHLKTVEINPTCIAEQTWQLPDIPNYPLFDMGPRLQRNRLDGGGRGEVTGFSQGREPGYPDHFVRTADAEEPPWETETGVPETQGPTRKPVWWLPRLFRRR